MQKMTNPRPVVKNDPTAVEMRKIKELVWRQWTFWGSLNPVKFLEIGYDLEIKLPS